MAVVCERNGDIGEVHRTGSVALVRVADEFFSHFQTDIGLGFLGRATNMGGENDVIKGTQGRDKFLICRFWFFGEDINGSPSILPLSKAAAKSSMFTQPPREALMKNEPSFILLKSREVIMSLVPGRSGTCRVTTSAFSRSSSKLPTCTALPSGSLVSVS